jgi:hypothetical protein
MQTTNEPLEPERLVEETWKPSDLPDTRLYKRLVPTVARMARVLQVTGDGTPVKEQRAVRRGAQRLFNNKRIDAEVLEAGWIARMRASLGAMTIATLILPHDTTEVDLHGRFEPEDAGPLRSNHARGYLVHSCVAVDAADGALLGVVSSAAWTRSWELHREDHHSRAPDDKESNKWREGIRQALKNLGPMSAATEIVHVFDREGQVHENFQFAVDGHHRIVARAASDCRIAEGDGKLWAYLESQPPCEIDGKPLTWTVQVERKPAKKKAAASVAQPVGPAEATVAGGTPRRPAATAAAARKDREDGAPRKREANVTMRRARITLTPAVKTDKGRRGRKPVKLWAVYVREVEPPVDMEPVEWMLLTTCQVESVGDALKVVGYYAARWGIEVFHKIFKTGLRMEQDHVEDLASFRRMLAVLIPVASHIARWTHAARVCPEQPAAPRVEPETIDMLGEACRMHRLPLPEGPWTIGLVVLRLAQLGGYEPRRGGQPGWLVIWRGWRVLEMFRVTWEHARARLLGGGPPRGPDTP